jgi:flagellar FliL protein
MADGKAAAIEHDADVDDDEGAAGEHQPKKLFGLPLALPPRKFLIVGGAAFLLLVGGGTGAYFFLFAGKPAAKTDAPAVKPAIFVDLPEIVVNLSNPGADRTQYLKLKIVLELPDQKMIEQIQAIMPRVIDAFQTYLRELRPSDLEGSAGLYRLKEELTRRINASISPSRITAVLFKEIVVQ